jgi:hypothetical protein
MLRTLALTALLAPVAVPVAAQPAACAPRDDVIARLADRYGETRQSIGLGSNNMMMELYASHDTGTWTIAVTRPDGLTCLVASGQAFETLAESLPAPREDA